MKIDIQESCLGTSCSQCVNICLARVFKQDSSNDKIIVNNPHRCFSCGHCVAICPVDTINHEKFDQNLPEMPSKLDTSLLLDNYAARRSIRFFKQKSVSKNHLSLLLKAMSSAPSAKNKRYLQVKILQEEKITHASELVIQYFESIVSLINKPLISILARLIGKMKQFKQAKRSESTFKGLIRQWNAGRDLIFYNAPLVFLIHSPPKKFSTADAYIAATQIIHVAHSLGLGTCFIGYFTQAIERMNNRNEAKKLLDVPINHKIEVALAIGYPNVVFKRIINREVPNVH